MLFFFLSGTEIDGWTISDDPSESSFAITTRQMTSCPNEVTLGYDRNKEVDKTFSIHCLS